MTLRRSWLILCSAIVLMLLAACGNGAAPTPAATAMPVAPSMTTPTTATVLAAPVATATAGDLYKDPQGRFTFTVPKGWTQEQSQDPNIPVMLKAPRPAGTFSVTTSSVPANGTLATFAEGKMADAKKLPRYIVGVLGTPMTTLGGQPAQKFDYFQGDKQDYYVLIMTIKGDTAYTLTFSTQPADVGAFSAQTTVILDSWKFL